MLPAFQYISVERNQNQEEKWARTTRSPD